MQRFSYTEHLRMQFFVRPQASEHVVSGKRLENEKQGFKLSFLSYRFVIAMM